MSELKIGANKLHEEQLYYSDGTTPLLLADLSLVRCELFQHGRLMASYALKPTHTDAEIRQGSSTSIVEIEITKELSATLYEGTLSAKLYLEKTDTDFVVDGEFAPIVEFDIVDMVK
jgi:hypothetical protein